MQVDEERMLKQTAYSFAFWRTLLHDVDIAPTTLCVTLVFDELEARMLAQTHATTLPDRILQEDALPNVVWQTPPSNLEAVKTRVEHARGQLVLVQLAQDSSFGYGTEHGGQRPTYDVRWAAAVSRDKQEMYFG